MNFKISNLTYLFLILLLLSGLFKNFLALSIIIFIHELGHIIVIKLLKYSIDSIYLYPFMGIININKKINVKIYHDLLISLGGIVNQLSFFIVLYLIKKYISIYFYQLLIMYNQKLIIFNLIPIYPLDGFKFINSLLNYLFSYEISYQLSIIINILVTIVIIFLKPNYFFLTFSTYSIIYLLKNYHLTINQFYIERLYYDFYYKKISYLKKPYKKYLKREYKHFYKNGCLIYDETYIITKKDWLLSLFLIVFYLVSFTRKNRSKKVC